MTTCDEIETYRPSNLARLTRLLLFLLMQGVAVILVGFVALFVSFEPVWSEEAPAAIAQSRRRALRLAAVEDR